MQVSMRITLLEFGYRAGDFDRLGRIEVRRETMMRGNDRRR
jgi:hypothetical protein